MKKIIIKISAILFVASLVVVSAKVYAQSVSGSGSGSASSATGIMPPPIFDNDTSNDDIVQLNNLRIVSVSSASLPAVVTASYDFGITCRRYESLQAPASSPLPCPQPKTASYSIRVDSDTRLFLRTRVKATLSDFVVGDLVNVFGFVDPNTRTVEAIIVRNLDKPVIERYLQLNNVTVIAGPSSQTFPATITVERSRLFPCYDYGERGMSMMRPFPCPLMQTQSATPTPMNQQTPGASQSATSIVRPNVYPYPYPEQSYMIEINSDTNLLNRVRQSLSLSDISLGDKLNIYGVLDSSRNIIRAKILRDISEPPVGGVQPPASSTVPHIDSLSPSQGIAGATVTVHGSGFSSTNTVYFDIEAIDAQSTDGTMLKFNVPESIEPPCARTGPIRCMMMTRLLTPGDYTVSVSNASGRSNNLTFTVTQSIQY